MLSRSPDPDLLPSEERWLRWEQRGRDNDTRFARRVRHAIGLAAVLLIAVLVLASFLR